MPRSRATDRRGASHDGPLFAVMGSVPQMIRHSQWSMSAYMRLCFVVGCVRTLAMTPVMPHTPPWLKLLTEPKPFCVRRSPMRNMRSPPAEQNRLDFGPRSGCFVSMRMSAHFASNSSWVIAPDSTSATSASTCFFGAQAYHSAMPGVPKVGEPCTISSSAVSQSTVSHSSPPRAPTRRRGFVMRNRSCASWMPDWPLRQIMPPFVARPATAMPPSGESASSGRVS